MDARGVKREICTILHFADIAFQYIAMLVERVFQCEKMSKGRGRLLAPNCALSGFLSRYSSQHWASSRLVLMPNARLV